MRAASFTSGREIKIGLYELNSNGREHEREGETGKLWESLESICACGGKRRRRYIQASGFFKDSFIRRALSPRMRAWITHDPAVFRMQQQRRSYEISPQTRLSVLGNAFLSLSVLSLSPPSPACKNEFRYFWTFRACTRTSGFTLVNSILVSVIEKKVWVYKKGVLLKLTLQFIYARAHPFIGGCIKDNFQYSIRKFHTGKIINIQRIRIYTGKSNAKL